MFESTVELVALATVQDRRRDAARHARTDEIEEALPRSAWTERRRPRATFASRWIARAARIALGAGRPRAIALETTGVPAQEGGTTWTR